MRPASNAIKLIDFGTATSVNKHHREIIGTRSYRAPEVILALGWDERSDIWALGCILIELYAGDPLFSACEGTEHLAIIEQIVAKLPSQIIERASKKAKEKHLTRSRQDGSWRVSWPERASSATAEHYVRTQLRLEQIPLAHHSPLAEFVRNLLALRASDRPAASLALQDPFFSTRFDD